MKGQKLLSVRDASGVRPRSLVVPNRWQGEVDCVVGPFVSKILAERFTNAGVDFGHYGSLEQRVFADGGAWYVEVRRLEAA